MSALRRSAVATSSLSGTADGAARALEGLIAPTRGILAWVARCAERAAQRRTLAQLTDWQLQDIGISRGEADAEAGKWRWRA